MTDTLNLLLARILGRRIADAELTTALNGAADSLQAESGFSRARCFSVIENALAATEMVRPDRNLFIAFCRVLRLRQDCAQTA